MTASRWHRTLSFCCAVAILVASLLIASPTAQAAPRTFVIEMAGFQFNPIEIRVDPGDVITLRVFNNDTTGHTFDITEFNVHIGNRASPLQPGQNATSTFTADPAGTYWFFCDVLGHATRSGSGYTGMAGRLVVGGSAPADLTLLFVVVGVAVAAGLVAFVLWRRRRSGNP